MSSLADSWDLSQIYQGYGDPAFQKDLAEGRLALQQAAEKVAGLTGAGLTEETVPPGPAAWEQSAALADALRAFDEAAIKLSLPEVYLQLAEAAGDLQGQEGAAAIRAELDQVARKKALIRAKLDESAASLDLAPEQLPAALTCYGSYLRECARLRAHRPSGEVLAAMLAMQENGGKGWLALRNELDRAACCRLAGEEEPRPLAEARGLAASADAGLRKRAYEAELRSYPSWETAMAACLNGIKGEALAELSYKNYASVQEEMLDVNRMRPETLAALHASLQKHLPVLRAYLRKKAQLLGHKNGMPWYDLTAPLPGNAVPGNGSTEKGNSSSPNRRDAISLAEAEALLLPVFRDFSPEIADLMERAFRAGWIDAGLRPGKQSGGICYDLPSLRENRILLGFDGSLRGVRLIAHELGHAYHNRCLDEVPLLLRDAPTPVCETASLMNETIFAEGMIARSRGRERLALLDADLTEVAQTVLDIYSRYLFEERVFREREKKRLTASEFCAMMREAQLEVYGEALDPQVTHPYMWMCKVHYYIPEFHYYNYPYYFGLLFARGLYAEYLEHPQGFAERYRALLAATGSASLEEIGRIAGVDITRQAFWDQAFTRIVNECEEFSRLADE
ncbi:MAG: hypothetical protein IJM69_09470 [Firmicutes bacterium]|nr:hypothetical protein [Bacillota bacterium]